MAHIPDSSATTPASDGKRLKTGPCAFFGLETPAAEFPKGSGETLDAYAECRLDGSKLHITTVDPKDTTSLVELPPGNERAHATAPSGYMGGIYYYHSVNSVSSSEAADGVTSEDIGNDDGVEWETGKPQGSVVVVTRMDKLGASGPLADVGSGANYIPSLGVAGAVPIHSYNLSSNAYISLGPGPVSLNANAGPDTNAGSDANAGPDPNADPENAGPDAGPNPIATLADLQGAVPPLLLAFASPAAALASLQRDHQYLFARLAGGAVRLVDVTDQPALEQLLGNRRVDVSSLTAQDEDAAGRGRIAVQTRFGTVEEETFGARVVQVQLVTRWARTTHALGRAFVGSDLFMNIVAMVAARIPAGIVLSVYSPTMFVVTRAVLPSPLLVGNYTMAWYESGNVPIFAFEVPAMAKLVRRLMTQLRQTFSLVSFQTGNPVEVVSKGDERRGVCTAYAKSIHDPGATGGEWRRTCANPEFWIRRPYRGLDGFPNMYYSMRCFHRPLGGGQETEVEMHFDDNNMADLEYKVSDDGTRLVRT